MIGDVHDAGLATAPQPTVYWPLMVANMWGQERFIHRSLGYTIRVSGTDREALAEDIRRAVWSVNGNLAVANMTGLDSLVAASRAQMSFMLVMLAIAAGAALVLAVVGIYGVIYYTVSQRTREIGIRVALGAGQRNIHSLVIRHGLLLICFGLALGLGSSFLLTRWMSSLLFGVGALDPLTYLVVTVLLASVALVATYAPARRAGRVDPLEALRWE